MSNPQITRCDDGWSKFAKETLAQKPRGTVQLALENSLREGAPSGLAIDLGTGAGNDAIFQPTTVGELSPLTCNQDHSRYCILG